MFVFKSRTNSKIGHVTSKTRSLGQIFKRITKRLNQEWKGERGKVREESEGEGERGRDMEIELESEKGRVGGRES